MIFATGEAAMLLYFLSVRFSLMIKKLVENDKKCKYFMITLLVFFHAPFMNEGSLFTVKAVR